MPNSGSPEKRGFGTLKLDREQSEFEMLSRKENKTSGNLQFTKMLLTHNERTIILNKGLKSMKNILPELATK